MMDYTTRVAVVGVERSREMWVGRLDGGWVCKRIVMGDKIFNGDECKAWK